MDAEHNVKLGDFGLAKRLNNEQNLAMTRMIDTYYLSPEQLMDEVFTPFQGSNQLQIAMKIKSEHLEPIPPKYSK